MFTYGRIFLNVSRACVTLASDHDVAQIPEAFVAVGAERCDEDSLEGMPQASQPSLVPMARGMIPFDLKTFATLKNSSQVVGGWSLFFSKSSLLYHMTFAPVDVDGNAPVVALVLQEGEEVLREDLVQTF